MQREPTPPPMPDLSQLSEIHIDPDTGENDAETQSLGHHRRPRSPRPAPWPGLGGDVAEADPRLRPIDPKLLVGVSRNAPCPCGSGKKFKHCHGSF